MNLNENINRIMGLMVTEGKSGTVRDMIEKHGLYDTVRLMGGYDRLKRMVGDIEILKEDKVSYIQRSVVEITSELGEAGFSPYEVGGEPILYYEDDEVMSQIEYFNPTFVSVDTYSGYKKEWNVGGYTMNYELLPDNVFDEVFDFIIGLHKL